MKKLPITIVMLTLNEEFNLPGVLENVKEWAGEIFIVDSCSTDRTVDIALEHGAKIVQRPFTNFGDQWNWALKKLPINTPWTLKLDTDERLTDKLKKEIATAIYDPHADDGYIFPRRLGFMGKPLRVKADVLRLWKTGKCRFSDVIVNEHPIIEGKVGRLKGVLEHLDSPNLHHWYEKQNRYSSMEAIMMVRGDKLAAEPKLFGTALERRMYLKKAFFKIPFRYQIQWLHEVLGRCAWRDGRIGLMWARLRVDVRRMRELKTKEMRLMGVIPQLPKSPRGGFDHRILDSPLQKKVVSKINQPALKNKNEYE